MKVGDTTILFSKAIIDIFASIIFATRLGYPMLLITIPQFIIMGGLFFCSQFLMVFISNTMILDFISIGGLLTIILSLNMIGISIVSMLISCLLLSLFSLYLIYFLLFFYKKSESYDSLKMFLQILFLLDLVGISH